MSELYIDIINLISQYETLLGFFKDWVIQADKTIDEFDELTKNKHSLNVEVSEKIKFVQSKMKFLIEKHDLWQGKLMEIESRRLYILNKIQSR